MTEITMEPHSSADQDIPLSYNGFVYVISGSVRIGEDGVSLQTGQLGWLDRANGGGMRLARIQHEMRAHIARSQTQNSQGDQIVSHGPFIGDSKADIVRLFNEYRSGQFARMSTLANHEPRLRPLPSL
jgi:quercetin 2,3-dioxygenase